MHSRNVYSNITPLPLSVSRQAALRQLRDHRQMIAMNPLVTQHERCAPPEYATLEEATSCTWYTVTDRISYLPGAPLANITYKIAFYDRPDGLQLHIHAPNGVDIKGYWKVGGNLPGEPPAPNELGIKVPKDRLYLHESVDLKCSVILAPFVKKNIRKAHTMVFHAIVEKCQEEEQRTALIEQARSEGKPDSPTVPLGQAYMIVGEERRMKHNHGSNLDSGSLNNVPNRNTGSYSIDAKRDTVSYNKECELQSPPAYKLIHPAFRSKSQASLDSETAAPPSPPPTPPARSLTPAPMMSGTIRAFQKEDYPYQPTGVYSPTEPASETVERVRTSMSSTIRAHPTENYPSQPAGVFSLSEATCERRQREPTPMNSTSTTRASPRQDYPYQPSDVYSPSEAACERGQHGPGCPHYFIATYGAIDWSPLEAITPVDERRSFDIFSPSASQMSPTEPPAMSPPTSRHRRTPSSASQTSPSSAAHINKPLPPIGDDGSASDSSSIYTPTSSILCLCRGDFHEDTCIFNKAQMQRSNTRFKTSSSSSRSSGDSAVFLPPPPIIPPRSALRPKYDPTTEHLKPRPLHVRRTWSVTLPETLRPRSPIPLRIVIPS